MSTRDLRDEVSYDLARMQTAVEELRAAFTVHLAV